MKKQLFKKTKIQGFLLIELMVSIIVFILLMFVMHRYLAMTILLASDACKRHETLTLIDSFITQIHQDPSVLHKEKIEKNGISITWALQPFNPYQNFKVKLSVLQCKKIDIIATYKNSRGEQRIVLSTGVVAL